MFITNYQPSIYLTGWDNLQTELNSPLAIKRATYAVWQEYQSFGLTSGMAHAADLVRAIFMLFLSIVLPKSILRYLFHFLMLYVGGLGLFYLLRYLGFNGKKKFLAFIGAVFYILNLGTVQIFGLPFEPFSVFFAFLPWEILVFLRFAYAEKINPGHIFWLVVVNILATPQAYLQTLFVVYFLCLGFLSFGLLFENLNKKIIKRFAAALGLIVLVNLFWILPQVYFVKNSLNVVREAKINQQATDVVSRQNIEKGTLRSFSRLEGFYYDLHGVSGESLFGPWHDHHSNVFIAILTYVPFAFLLLGIFKKHRSHYGFVSIFVLISLLLLSNTSALTYFSFVIFDQPFVKQIFRSPFTKFIVPYSLIFSYLFVSGLEALHNFIEKKSAQGRREVRNIIFTSSVVMLMIIYALPAFLGHFFSSTMKVQIPESYHQTIAYFKDQDRNKRIALLPDYTFWGWFKHGWGYDGSGFIWYGIEQPIVSRTFDVWSLNSESYFWEIKYAIESKNTVLFEEVLDKYNIDYLIYDKSLRPVSSVEEGMQYDQIDWILERTGKVYLAQQFDNLSVLVVDHDHNIESFVSVADNLSEVSPLIKVTNLDQAYLDFGDYKVSTPDDPDYIYPFLDLTTQTRVYDALWSISEDEGNFYFKANLGRYNLDNYDLAQKEVSAQAKVFLGDEISNYDFIIEEYWEEDTLVIKVGKEKIESFNPTYVSVDNCSQVGDFSVSKRGPTLNVSSTDRGTACFGYASSLLDHWNAYLVKVDSENVTGKEFFFYIFGNKERKQSKLETNLVGGAEHFILNPGYYYDDGYFFSFQNSSYNLIPSENNLNLLEVYLLPFDYLKSTKLVKKDTSSPQAQFLAYLDVEKAKYYAYEVKDAHQHTGNDLILYQSFDEGWHAYIVKNPPFIFGKKIESHYVVNNWANGWKIPQMEEDEHIALIFWPQILEYTGIAVLIVVCIALPMLVAFSNKPKKQQP